MVRGQPDYGITAKTPVASGISDPGEAAARLGSINVYDRRGWTVWMDDFEAPALKWRPFNIAPGTAPVLSTVNAWMGVQSVSFTAPSGVLSESYIERKFPLLRLGRAGVEIWVCGTTEMPGYIYLKFLISDGVNQTRGTWKLDTVNNIIYIYSGGVDVPIATNVFGKDDTYNFLPIKLVVDMDTDHYTRLLVGPDEYDLSSYPLEPVALFPLRFIQVDIGAKSNNSLTDIHAYTDNFILTQNEP